METSIRTNPKLWVITIYLFLMAAFVHVRPGVAFGREGQIRPFGVGKKDSTVFPLWWWVFVLAAVSYLVVAVLLRYSK
jgi:hypothetical protein